MEIDNGAYIIRLGWDSVRSEVIIWPEYRNGECLLLQELLMGLGITLDDCRKALAGVDERVA